MNISLTLEIGTKLLKPFRILVLAPTLDTYLSLHWELAIRQVSVLLCITALNEIIASFIFNPIILCYFHMMSKNQHMPSL
jgi:hypothetical protein